MVGGGEGEGEAAGVVRNLLPGNEAERILHGGVLQRLGTLIAAVFVVGEVELGQHCRAYDHTHAH